MVLQQQQYQRALQQAAQQQQVRIPIINAQVLYSGLNIIIIIYNIVELFDFYSFSPLIKKNISFEAIYLVLLVVPN